jgi:uncharacterized protein YigA (DUF484 family)
MELDDLAVAQFLRADPRFFERNPRLLDEIVLPDPHGGAAISLVERQQAALRERSRSLEMKLAELVKFGEENDVISERVHRLASAMMGARDFDALVGALYDSLRDDFLVPHAVLRLWDALPAGVDATRPEFSPVEEELKSWAEGLAHPYCGHRPGLDVGGWFGETVAPLKSFALVPLRLEKTVGLLAMASEDEQRFYPEMGTLYLKRIGELLSRALSRI